MRLLTRQFGTHRGDRTIRFAVRFRVLARNLGQVYLAVAVLMSAPVAVSLGFAAFRLAAVQIAVCVGLAGVGYVLQRVEAPDEMQTNEAMASVGLVFLTVPLWLTPIFMTTGLALGDAGFESLAAVTTAGMSMLSSVGELPPALIFTRAWIQWFGGLGFVALAFALVTRPGVATRRVGAEFDRDLSRVSGTRERARWIVMVYGGITAGGFLLLWLTSGDPFLAVTHALAAVATGGYSAFDRGPAGFGALAPQLVVLLLCILGALSFDLHGRLHRRRWQAFLTDPGLRALLVAIAVVAGAILVLETSEAGGSVWRAVNLAVMAQTTAGFTTVSLSELAPATQIVLAVSMLMGGDIGSTAGGFKLLRLVIVLRLIQLLLARTALPQHGVVHLHVEGRRVAEPELIAVLVLLVLLFVLVTLSWLVFVASGMPPLAAFVEVSAAVSTGGLSAGLTDSDLAWPLKLVLAADMLAGRLEIVALCVLVHPATWLSRRRS